MAGAAAGCGFASVFRIMSGMYSLRMWRDTYRPSFLAQEKSTLMMAREMMSMEMVVLSPKISRKVSGLMK